MDVTENGGKKSKISLGAFSSMLMQDYACSWGVLQNAIHHLLSLAPGQHVPLSYEETYSCVYKCVCQGYSEQLYADLLQQLTEYLTGKDNHLCQAGLATNDYIILFDATIRQYLQALDGIIPIFIYMNRFYVELRMGNSLETILRNLLMEKLVSRHADLVLSILDDAQRQPFTIDPGIAARITRNLYNLDSGYTQLKPSVFRKFIPETAQCTALSLIDVHIEETRRMEEQILLELGHHRGDQSRKRNCSVDDAEVPP